jgi:hypothetical protein
MPCATPLLADDMKLDISNTDMPEVLTATGKISKWSVLCVRLARICDAAVC